MDVPLAAHLSTRFGRRFGERRCLHQLPDGIRGPAGTVGIGVRNDAPDPGYVHFRGGWSAAFGASVGVGSLSHDIAPHLGEKVQEGPGIIKTALYLGRQSKRTQRITAQASLMADHGRLVIPACCAPDRLHEALVARTALRRSVNTSSTSLRTPRAEQYRTRRRINKLVSGFVRKCPYPSVSS
jgi:hypothetical protein